jgi:hypothetical protein
MALSGIVKHKHDNGVVTFIDGTTPTAITCAARYDMADFTVGGLKRRQLETVVYQSRQRVRSIRSAQRKFGSFSLTLMLTEFSEATTGTILDFLYRTAGTPYENCVSTDVVKSDVDLCNIQFVMEGTDLGDSSDHTLTWGDVEIDEIGIAEGEPNNITINGTIYGDVSGDLADIMLENA